MKNKVTVLKLPKKFTIFRKNWARGDRDKPNLLLDKEGNMCCLGFAAESAGCSRKDLLNTAGPTGLLHRENIKITGLTYRGSNRSATQICISLICTNDNSFLSDEERENRITKLFKKLDVDVEFK